MRICPRIARNGDRQGIDAGMSLGLADRQGRGRRQLLWGLVKWTFLLFLALVAALFVYQTGLFVGQDDVQRLQTQVADLTSRVEALQIESAGYKARAAQVQQELQQLEQRRQAELPSGDAKVLLDLAQQQLKAGATMERLTSLLNAAANPRVCDPTPESKRFTVKLSGGKPGKDASAVFADRRITVTAEGQPVVNSNGKKETWYDPQQPVTVHFTLLDGTVKDATGLLPLQQQLVIADSEYRFSVAADEKKNYAVITAERCNFP